MRFATGVSDQADAGQAVRDVVQQARKQLQGSRAHVAFLFASILYQADWKPLLSQIREELGSPLLLGCTGGGIIGSEQELEGSPALSLAAGVMPGVKLHPFAVSPEDLAEERDPGFWIEKIGASPMEDPVGVLLPDPFTCDAMALVSTLNAVYPKMPLIGGLASGASQAGENILFYNDELLSEGAVGTLLTGNITLQTIVSQGCRPIGRPYIVTKVEENVILELAGMSATEALQRLFNELSDADKRLARTALLLGVVMNEYKEKFQRGDFLIRNLIGIDPASGAIAVGDRIQAGQTIQFHVRDADTSREDLQLLLEEKTKALSKSGLSGGLLFSCLGRGRDLYGEPHVDIRTIREALGSNCPIAGFFCNGEIGPVGKQNYIHGFTSSLGLFRPRSDRST